MARYTPACDPPVPVAVTLGCQTRAMAFGQAAGPPASRRQVETLEQLVRAAGHIDFRDARGPLGLNQRQAGGRFTRDEADALITRLEAEAEAEPPAPDEQLRERPPARAAGARVRTSSRHRAELADSLRRVPVELLAAELQRRGWVVMEP
jgi:hypothetical protein